MLYCVILCRSQWPRRLRPLACWYCGFESARALKSVSCKCCVLSGRGLCDELIVRPEESYRLCCVVVCDLETSWMRRPWPTGGCRAKRKQQNVNFQCWQFCSKTEGSTSYYSTHNTTKIMQRTVTGRFVSASLERQSPLKFIVFWVWYRAVW
jgi:hypothetical protein